MDDYRETLDASDARAPEPLVHARRTARLFETAGRHFNRGQRAFFLALGYLGWFVSPWALIAATAGVVVVMGRRQLASDSLKALVEDLPATTIGQGSGKSADERPLSQ